MKIMKQWLKDERKKIADNVDKGVYREDQSALFYAKGRLHLLCDILNLLEEELK